MSKKYPCPAGREDDCGYPACAHDRQCELAASTCSLPSFVETAFVFAARYTHHRDTGGTLAVCRALAYMWPDLSESTKEQIIKESHEATTNLWEWAEFRGDEPENDQ